MTKAHKPRKRGRPPLGKRALGPPLALRLPHEMLKAIDAIADGRMDRPDRSAVVRELVAEALTARARKAGR